VASSAGCSRDAPSTPEGALSAFVSAMQSSRSDVGARRRAYELLSDGARAALSARAARASQLSGRILQPWTMLAPGRFTLRVEPFDSEGLSSRITGDRAVVIVRGTTGDHIEVPMVREHGQWRVELSLPPMQPL
jgi:hypothetical protein